MQFIIEHDQLAEQLAAYAAAEESTALVVGAANTLSVHDIVAVREAARRCDRVVVGLLPAVALSESQRQLLGEAGADILLQLPAKPVPLAVAWPAQHEDMTALTQLVLAVLPLIWVLPLAQSAMFLAARQLEQTFPNLTTLWYYTTPEHVLAPETQPLRQALLSAKKLRQRGERQVSQLLRAVQGQLDVPAVVSIYDAQSGQELTQITPKEAVYIAIDVNGTYDGLYI